jgi:hypothetical protein
MISNQEFENLEAQLLAGAVDEPKTDVINSPQHYATGNVECIDAIEAAGYGEAFCRGNAIKYLWRAGKKETGAKEIEDLDKAAWYVARAREQAAKRVGR